MLSMIRATSGLILLCIGISGCTAQPSSALSSEPSMSYRPEHHSVTMCPGWTDPQNLGSPINTSGWEDSPSISPDGQYLYFSYADYDFLTFLASKGKRRVRTGPDRGTHANDLADIMVSQRIGNAWQPPRMLEGVSTPFALDDGAFTQDGTILVHSGMRNDCVGGSGASDIFMATWDGKKWGVSRNFGAPVCTSASESNPWISADGNFLLFDSDRVGGHGSRDLWSCEKVHGRWQSPVNLGAPINTEREEVQPFMTLDGKELWFAGEDRSGSNDHVIFMSRRESNGTWSKPEVIVRGMVGEPTLTADNQQLYFVHIYHSRNGYNADVMCSVRQKLDAGTTTK